jgi:transposase
MEAQPSSQHSARRPESPEVSSLRAIVSKLREEGRDDDAFEHSFSAVQAVVDHVRLLELKLLAMRKAAVGKTSERVDTQQLALLLDELASLQDALGGEVVDSEEEARADAALDKDIEKEREEERARAKSSDGARKRERGIDTSGVEAEEHLSELSEALRTQAESGAVAKLIGHDKVESLEYEPGRFVLHVTKVAKYGFGGDGSAGVLTAPAPAKVIPRGLAGTSLLADIIVGKHVDHLPLNRLHHRYLRAGVNIPLSTLAEWIAASCDTLAPVAERLWERVEAATVVRIDASGLKVQDPDADENIVRGSMWCLVGDDRDVTFRYAEDGRGESGPWQYLAKRAGYVQADAASVFGRLYNGRVARSVEVGCNAHARRKFVALMDSDSRVAYVLQLYGRLYKVERLAKLRKLDADGVRALRQQHSGTIVDKLYRWLAKHANDDPPDSAFAKAIAYAINHRKALTRFLEDGRLDIDNNLCEQQIRSLALGRKNFLFAGSHAAAHRLAVGYTLTRTCAMHGVAPQPYLTDVLTKLAAGWPHKRLDELLPDRWLQLHAPSAKSRP